MLTINPKAETEKTIEPIAVNSVEACRLLGVSTGTLTKWTKENRIPHKRIGRRLLYPIAGLKQFLAGEQE